MTVTDIADTLQHLQLDAEPETRTLLDIGDGPLSIVFELLSTPGVGIRSVAAGAQTCTALRDVLKGWHTRHENASSTKDLEAAELFFTDIMDRVGTRYDSIAARAVMLSKTQGIAYDTAKGVVCNDIRYDCDLLFDDLCRASGRSRATTERLLRLTPIFSDTEEPDILGMYELELRITNRDIFVTCVESDDRSEYRVVRPSEYAHVFQILGTFGQMPLRVQDKLLAAGLVQNTPQCTGRAPWSDSDDSDDDAETELYSESEEEDSELADTEEAESEEDEEDDSELDEVEAFRRYADSALAEFRSTGTVVAPDRVLNALRTLLESRGINEAAEQLGRRLDFDIDEQD